MTKTSIKNVAPAMPGLGDEAATSIDALYRRHAAELANSLKKTFGAGPPEPDDVVQATFAKYASLDDPVRIKNPRAYLYATARNIIRDHKRRQQRNDAFIAEALHGAGIANLEEITPERVIVERERLAIMAATLKRLPRKQRTVVAMSRLDGRTYEEISRATGWSLADISRQMTMAMRTIADALERPRRAKHGDTDR